MTQVQSQPSTERDSERGQPETQPRETFPLVIWRCGQQIQRGSVIPADWARSDTTGCTVNPAPPGLLLTFPVEREPTSQLQGSLVSGAGRSRGVRTESGPSGGTALLPQEGIEKRGLQVSEQKETQMR